MRVVSCVVVFVMSLAGVVGGLAFTEASETGPDGKRYAGMSERVQASVLLTMITTEEIAALLGVAPEEAVQLFELQDVAGLVAASRP